MRADGLASARSQERESGDNLYSEVLVVSLACRGQAACHTPAQEQPRRRRALHREREPPPRAPPRAPPGRRRAAATPLPPHRHHPVELKLTDKCDDPWTFGESHPSGSPRDRPTMPKLRPGIWPFGRRAPMAERALTVISCTSQWRGGASGALAGVTRDPPRRPPPPRDGWRRAVWKRSSWPRGTELPAAGAHARAARRSRPRWKS